MNARCVSMKLLVVILLVFPINMMAQDAIVPSGGNGTGSNGSFSYTVGQIEYTTLVGVNGSVSQGVQQPFEVSVGFGAELKHINLELSAYPNPTTDYLFLSVEDVTHSDFRAELYDLRGRLLRSIIIEGETTKIDMKRYEQAIYLVHVYDNNSIVKTFKIIKRG